MGGSVCGRRGPGEVQLSAVRAAGRSRSIFEGFFNESLPPVFGSTSTERPVTVNNAPTLALLRIDADAYDGVLDALEGAYHRLSPGGFVIIDDWHLGGARAAVHAFRRRFSIKGPIRSSPSDLVLTCSTDLTAVASCATGRALLAQSKAYTVTVLPHVAYWRKGGTSPGPPPLRLAVAACPFTRRARRLVRGTRRSTPWAVRALGSAARVRL